MKKLVYLCVVGMLFTTVTNANEVKRGAVVTKEGEFLHIGAIIGGRILADGGEEAIDLRPQSVEKYYDKTLSQGKTLKTAIHQKLQYVLSEVSELKSMNIRAKETLIGVMNTHTGELVALARNDDYITIKTKKIPLFKDKFADLLFEPNELILPVMFAMTFNHYTYDKDLTNRQNYEKSLVTLTPTYIEEGLRQFGFGKPSGIDLPYDVAGNISGSKDIESMGKIKVTFMQMLKAYSVFSAKGDMRTPHLGVTLTEGNNTQVLTYPERQCVSKKTATSMKRGLRFQADKHNYIDKRQFIKTGGFVGKGKLYSEDNSSNAYSGYFGYVEDIYGRNYTIGILSLYDNMETLNNYNKRYAQNISPSPIVNEMIDVLVEQKLLRLDEVYKNKKAMSPLPDGEIETSYASHDDAQEACFSHTKKVKGLPPLNFHCRYITYRTQEDKGYVKTVLDGTVILAGDYQGVGKVIILKHDNDLYTIYSNLDYIFNTIKVGTKIKKGYTIGKVDEILRFQLAKEGELVDPLEYLEL